MFVFAARAAVTGLVAPRSYDGRSSHGESVPYQLIVLGIPLARLAKEFAQREVSSAKTSVIVVSRRIMRSIVRAAFGSLAGR
jgi:hypothetical protein